MNDEPKKPYPVGYANPPAETRFKPGQSGNPRGRPKGVPNFATAVARILREKVTVIENGRRRSVSKLEAAATQLVNKAVKGDARAFQQTLQLAELVGVTLATDQAVDFKEVDKGSEIDITKLNAEQLGWLEIILGIAGPAQDETVVATQPKSTKE